MATSTDATPEIGGENAISESECNEELHSCIENGDKKCNHAYEHLTNEWDEDILLPILSKNDDNKNIIAINSDDIIDSFDPEAIIIIDSDD